MFKKFSALSITLVLIISMVSGFSVVAANDNNGANSFAVRVFVDKANNEVRASRANNNSLGNPIAAANKALVAEKLVVNANEKILSMVEKAMKSKNPDLDKLVRDTNAIAFRTIEAAAKFGVIVVCEYQAFEINGQTVLIDPLKIISR